ncbi:TY-Chap domain-containing protein [Nocardia rhizosphaerae]|uniref:TY-Chap N-terminal domain-containing protein n=1 Tax=Nocardia rhizosphaerae TaxID=1691571 RepID=A0ABV8L1X5_9NOCA
MTSWPSFTDALAGQLAVLPAGAVVILRETRTQSPRYAQFRQLDHVLAGELVCDDALTEPLRAGAEGDQVIIAAGWQPPEDGLAGNWWLELPWPATAWRYHEVAAMVVTGLRDGYGVREPDELSYRAWDESAGNRPLDLPLLGLPRA